MSYSLVQAKTAAGTASSVTVSCAATGAGNLLVLLIGTANNPGNNTFTAPTGWSQADSTVDENNFIGMTGACFYLANNGGGITSVTATLNAAPSQWDAILLEFSGVATATPVDVTVHAVNTNTNATSGTVSATTLASGDLLVGFLVFDETVTAVEPTVTEPTGWTHAATEQDINGWLALDAAYTTQASAGTATYNPTWTSHGDTILYLLAFKSGGASTHTLGAEARARFSVRIKQLAIEDRSRFSIRTTLGDEARDQFQVRTSLGTASRSRFSIAAKLAVAARDKFILAAKLAVEARDRFTLAAKTAPGLVQSNTALSTGNATSLAISLPSNSTAGNLLVLYASGAQTNNGGRTISTPTGYTAVGAQGQHGREVLNIFYKANTSGGTNESVTVTFSTSDGIALVLEEWGGMGAATSLDVTAEANGAGTTPSVTAGAANSQASELQVAAISNAGGATQSGITSGWTVDGSDLTPSGATDSNTLYTYNQVVSSVGTATIGGTLSGSDAWVAILATFKVSGAATHTQGALAQGSYLIRINSLASEGWNRFSVRVPLAGEARDHFQVRIGQLAVQTRDRFALRIKQLAVETRDQFKVRIGTLAVEARDKFRIRISQLAAEARNKFVIFSSLKQLGLETRDRFLIRAGLGVESRDRYLIRIHQLAVEGRDTFWTRISTLASEGRSRFSIRAGLAAQARDRFVLRISDLAVEARDKFLVFAPGAKQLGLELRDRFLIRVGLGAQSRDRFNLKTGLSVQARDRFALRFSEAVESRSRFLIRTSLGLEERAQFRIVLGLKTLGRSQFVIRKALKNIGRAVFRVYQLVAPPQPATLSASFFTQQRLTASFSTTQLLTAQMTTSTQDLHATFTTR